jgi:hypothetical protein
VVGECYASLSQIIFNSAKGRETKEGLMKVGAHESKGVLAISAKKLGQNKEAATIDITWDHISNKKGACCFKKVHVTELNVYKMSVDNGW